LGFVTKREISNADIPVFFKQYFRRKSVNPNFDLGSFSGGTQECLSGAVTVTFMNSALEVASTRLVTTVVVRVSGDA